MTETPQHHAATVAHQDRKACPGCGGTGPFPEYAAAEVDTERLSTLAFASRKAPELMHHRLVTCKACDLLFANPVPPPRAIEMAYADAAFDSPDEARCASRTYAQVVSGLLSSLPNRDGVLDIGTGEGSFLEEMIKLGFTNVAGVEPSAAPVRAAKPDIRPLIRQEPFNPAAFAPASLALVTCFQTLEHVFEPANLVRSVLTLLRPGGAFVAVCHDRRALSAKILGKKSPIFDIEHLQLFSPKSGAALLTHAGYDRVRAHMIFNKYPVHYWAKLLPIPGDRKTSLVTRLKRSSLGRAEVGLPAGNQVILGFKPRHA